MTSYSGPLGVPRFTNIGPFSSEDIGELIFRGGNLHTLNQTELRHGVIHGNEMTLYELHNIHDNIQADDRFSKPRHHMWGKVAKALYDYYDESEAPLSEIAEYADIEKTTRPVTGGMTRGIGAAIRFAKSGSRSDEKDVPVVLYLDRTRIQQELIDIEYTYEFRDKHPHIAGHADKGSLMARYPEPQAYEDDDRMWYKNIRESQDDLILKFLLDPLDNFTDLRSEREVCAYSSQVDISNAIVSTAVYLTPIRLNLLYRDWFDEPLYDTANNAEIMENLESDFTSPDEYLEDIYTAIQGRMAGGIDDELVICMIEKWGKAQRRRIKQGNFITLYDGVDTTSQYDQAVPFTDPTQVDYSPRKVS